MVVDVRRIKMDFLRSTNHSPVSLNSERKAAGNESSG